MEFEKLQVVHCLGWVGYGGVEERRVILAEHLESNLYQHVLFCQTARGPLAKKLVDRGWQVRELGSPRSVFDVRWFFCVLRAAKDLNPAIIHGAVSEGNLIAHLLSLAHPTAKIINEETSDGVGRRVLGRALVKLLYRRADAVVAVSPAVEDYLLTKLSIPPSQVRMILNGVQLPNNFDAQQLVEFRDELGIPHESLVVGTVGRLVDTHKRFSDLIRTLPQLNREFEGLTLLIVGEGPDRKYLEDLSTRLGVRRSVVFSGYREKDRPFFQVMDVFALASSMEAFGLVVAEAMLARVPIIASAVGGIPHILDDGSCGTLVRPNQPPQLGREIANCLRNLNPKSETVERAYERAANKFGPTGYVRSVEELWRTLVGVK